MKNPILWIVVSILLILLGTGLLTYSGVCLTVEKNGKKRSAVHTAYIIFGIICILISIFIFFLVARDYNRLLKEINNVEKVAPGMTLVPLPENFGKWAVDNTNINPQFTKILGNYINNNYGNIKNIKNKGYISYKN